MKISIIFIIFITFKTSTADLAGQNRLGNTVQTHLKGVQNKKQLFTDFVDQIKTFYGDDVVSSEILRIAKRSTSRRPRRMNLRIKSYMRHFQ